MPSSKGHEGDGIREKWVMVTAAGLAVALPLFMIFVWLRYQSLAGSRYGGLTAPTILSPKSEPTQVFPLPQPQSVPGAQLRDVRALEDLQLTNYGWIDPSNGVVRIPIDRAMEILAQRGLPVRSSKGESIGPSEYELTIQRRLDQNFTPIKEVK